MGFEEGTHALSLPELEILAQYLGSSPEILLDEATHYQNGWTLLEDNIRTRYQTLRSKVIRMQLTLVRQSADLSLGDVHATTQIPLDVLGSYEIGTLPIPITDLEKISASLGKPIGFFFPNRKLSEALSEDQEDDDWQQEFPVASAPSDPYKQLLAALQYLPKERQAHIAKILLNELESL